MKLSTRMRYGTRALVELAGCDGGETLSIKKLAERQRLSVKYLEQIMASLKKAGVVVSTAGVRGGYRLARPANQINMEEVFLALEGSLGFVHCVEDPDGCDHAGTCPTIKLWRRMSENMKSILNTTTLHELSCA